MDHSTPKNHSNKSVLRSTSMEKQVLFESKVDIMSTPSNWAMPTTPLDYPSSVPSSVPSSGELLGWPLVSLAKVSSTGYSKFGLQHSTSIIRGTSNYNYGYSTVETPDKLGLLLFSNIDDGNVEDDRHNHDCSSSSCIWAHDPQQRWIMACWTCIGFLSLLILAVLAMILTFCIIIPKSPYWEVPNEAFLVQSLNVTPSVPMFNTSNIQRGMVPGQQKTARLNANFTLQLLVKNPNRVRTDFSSSRFSVSYGDTVAGEAMLEKFSQKAHESMQKSVELIADVSVVQQNMNDSVSLQVDGRVRAQLQIMGLSTPAVLVKLGCSVKIKVKELQTRKQARELPYLHPDSVPTPCQDSTREEGFGKYSPNKEWLLLLLLAKALGEDPLIS
ncbi:unnamed protein product [Calypogeia fissa]